jgi:hypothetical protein
MRRFVALLLVIIMLLGVGHSPESGTGDGPSIPTNGLKVEERFIYVYQNDDRTTFQVDELIFFNNSGTSTYNGTTYSWIPEGSNVVADYYGNATDTGCRILGVVDLYCFPLSYQDGNIAFGNPFGGSKLSYFGEKGTVTVNADSQNFSYSDYLALNVTLGSETEAPNPSVPTGSGIHVMSDSVELGVKVRAMPGLTANMTLTQTVTVFNNGTQNDTVDLEVLSAPSDWTASFLRGSQEIASLALNISESKNVTLHLSVPSYLAEVIVTYTTSVPRSSQDYNQLLFDKTFLYDNDRVVFYIYTVEGDNITVSGGINLVHSQWSEENQRTMHVLLGTNVQSGTETMLTIVLEPDQNISWILLAAALLAFLAIVAYALMRKRRKRRTEKAAEGKEGATAESEAEGETVKREKLKTSKAVKGAAVAGAVAKGEKGKGGEKDRESGEEEPEDAALILKKKESIAEALTRLENDHENGLLADDVYLNMKDNLNERNLKLDERLRKVKGDGVATLELEKEKILKAAKQLDSDLESGAISKAAYTELRNEYKRRTIEILKDIDKMKKD